MDDDFEDLLGFAPEPEDDEEDHAQGGGQTNESMTEKGALLVQRGVTPGWFASVLGIGRTTVNRKLADVLPKRIIRNNTKLYDVRECLPFLVQPHDLKQHLVKMNPKDLPERLRKEFWGARKLEQEVRLRAGDLYLSPDVHRSYGDLMKIVKDTVMLWTDDLDESTGLTSAQVEILDMLCRKLLADFAAAVEQCVAQGSTRSQESELDEDFDDA